VWEDVGAIVDVCLEVRILVFAFDGRIMMGEDGILERYTLFYVFICVFLGDILMAAFDVRI
jgi:hypothetical protein